MFTLSSFFDSAGPMTKSARDLIPLLETLSTEEKHLKYREDWTGLSIGFGDPDIWNLWESVCPQHEGTVEQMV
jgi:amidase